VKAIIFLFAAVCTFADPYGEGPWRPHEPMEACVKLQVNDIAPCIRMVDI